MTGRMSGGVKMAVGLSAEHNPEIIASWLREAAKSIDDCRYIADELITHGLSPEVVSLGLRTYAVALSQDKTPVYPRPNYTKRYYIDKVQAAKDEVVKTQVKTQAKTQVKTQTPKDILPNAVSDSKPSNRHHDPRSANLGPRAFT